MKRGSYSSDTGDPGSHDDVILNVKPWCKVFLYNLKGRTPGQRSRHISAGRYSILTVRMRVVTEQN